VRHGSVTVHDRARSLSLSRACAAERGTRAHDYDVCASCETCHSPRGWPTEHTIWSFRRRAGEPGTNPWATRGRRPSPWVKVGPRMRCRNSSPPARGPRRRVVNALGLPWPGPVDHLREGRTANQNRVRISGRRSSRSPHHPRSRFSVGNRPKPAAGRVRPEDRGAERVRRNHHPAADWDQVGTRSGPTTRKKGVGHGPPPRHPGGPEQTRRMEVSHRQTSRWAAFTQTRAAGSALRPWPSDPVPGAWLMPYGLKGRGELSCRESSCDLSV